jgi:uncharacterized membrane protein
MSAERRFDLALATLGVGAVLCVLCVLLTQGTAAAVVGGVGLVLVAPGWALTLLVFRRDELRGTEKLLVAVGASLAVAVLGALLLDVLPGDLGRTPWLILLGTVTVVALAGATVLRRPRPVPGAINERAPLVIQRFENEDDDRVPRRHLPPLVNLILAALTVAVLATAVLIARDAANESPGFTELSAVPVAGAGGESTLRIAVRNEEGAPASYRLRVVGPGGAPAESSFTLEPGAAKSISGGSLGGEAGRIDVALYRGGAPEPFLHTSYDPALGQGQSAEGQ